MSGPAEEDANLDPESLVIIAHATRTRGLKGEVVADLLTDFPERFAGLSRLIAVPPSGEPWLIELEHHWFQKGRVILKFAGFDTIETATALVGHDFAVPEDESVPLTEDEYYDWQLEGCKVEVVTGTAVGTVTSVMRTGGVHLLVVTGANGKECLIPMAGSIVVSIDTKAQRIVIDPPEGLLEL
jgi:16S rRNA processing protein RimM